MSSRIGKTGWLSLYVIAGVIDIVQFLIDFTGIGIGVNEIADPFIGAAAAGYFQWRGVSMISHVSRLVSLLGVTALEELTAGVAPAWIVDVWYIHRSVKQEEATEKAAREQEEFMVASMQQPLNEDGMRAPGIQNNSTTPQPAYMDGVRAPGGGLNN
jgi:hypothetical protein